MLWPNAYQLPGKNTGGDSIERVHMPVKLVRALSPRLKLNSAAKTTPGSVSNPNYTREANVSEEGSLSVSQLSEASHRGHSPFLPTTSVTHKL